jgi:hypothetical protein
MGIEWAKECLRNFEREKRANTLVDRALSILVPEGKIQNVENVPVVGFKNFPHEVNE